MFPAQQPVAVSSKNRSRWTDDGMNKSGALRTIRLKFLGLVLFLLRPPTAEANLRLLFCSRKPTKGRTRYLFQSSKSPFSRHSRLYPKYFSS
ncbi:hypothetical protein SODALDRAFT_331109 [Sodiomyces alkalinus F11]|uniref:Uncharacterized protein n=1 Tax=Sodiomyces alkalinus (strain CBS 110278 / VKM F-3762 / F11) TaxID=1314773 RepID=A0A3N2Q3Y6_SODAK|nr:hypothetical protein SODALDRAFT_331109 [Sodiomyces alkalinus F11]ROT41388.1 hypothetical protein SODALDRAFT_331109 [Sodiomyces alkalinus F11]